MIVLITLPIFVIHSKSLMKIFRQLVCNFQKRLHTGLLMTKHPFVIGSKWIMGLFTSMDNIFIGMRPFG